MTLDVLDKAKENGVKMEILFSNHSSWFFEYRMTGVIPDDARPDGRPGDNKGQGRSIHSIESMKKNPNYTREKLIEKVERIYDPKTFKLVSWTINPAKKDSGKKDKITIFTHAPFDLNCLKALAESDLFKDDVVWKADNARELAETLDKINERFQYLMTNQPDSIFERVNLDAKYAGATPPALGDPRKYPLAGIIWNRNTETLDCNKTEDLDIEYVHGHNGESPEHATGIDQSFGKSLNNTGEAHNVKLTPQKRAKEHVTFGYSAETHLGFVKKNEAAAQVQPVDNKSDEEIARKPVNVPVAFKKVDAQKLQADEKSVEITPATPELFTKALNERGIKLHTTQDIIVKNIFGCLRNGGPTKGDRLELIFIFELCPDLKDLGKKMQAGETVSTDDLVRAMELLIPLKPRKSGDYFEYKGIPLDTIAGTFLINRILLANIGIRDRIEFAVQYIKKK